MIPARPGAFVLMLAAVSVLVSGQTALPTWTLGVAAIPRDARELQRYPSLGVLPIQVLEGVHDLDWRFLSDAEILKIREKSLLEKQYEAGAAAARLRDRRDAAALSPVGTSERAVAERILRTERERGLKIDAASRPAAAKLEDASDGGPWPEIRRIVLWEGHGSDRLIDAGTDPGGACSREKVDYLILWEAAEVSGFLRIRMIGWNAVLGRADFVRTAYCPSDDIASAAAELSQGLARAASGRPTARLVFDVEPAEARIRVDGRLLASGRRSIRIYEEREYLVSLELGTGITENYSIRSQFGKDSVLTARLEPLQSSSVLVETEPPGASLHLDGIWAGTTPEQAQLFGYARVARLVLPGFQDEYRVIEPAGRDRILIRLRETEHDGIPVFDRRKERFYQALGRLAVGLPVTLLSYGVYLQSSALYLEYPGNLTFQSRKESSLVVFAMSSGITAGLLASASIRLAQYIQSAR